MWPFSANRGALATGLSLQYSLAHGSEMEWNQPRSRPCPAGDHSDGRLGRVREDQGGEAGVAQVFGRGCPVHNTCAGGQTGQSRRVFQCLGEERDADEVHGFLGAVVGGCSAKRRRTHVHVPD